MDISANENPIALFQQWLDLAIKTEPQDANAMALATVDKNGKPSVRMVLLKDASEQGFTFYTNTLSRKGHEMAGNPNVAVCFHWKSQNRQVRVEGKVELVPAPIVDAYFKSRHYLSRLGAWASQQSRPLQSRAELESRVKELETKYKDGDVPRPPHWSGYLIIPTAIEFWQQGEGRLHDRFLFEREGANWRMARLNP